MACYGLIVRLDVLIVILYRTVCMLVLAFAVKRGCTVWCTAIDQKGT